ncbi:KTSC domain-containing protein [Pandoraea apista]|uniref:KTSC domain-containing protein n=1 Tax=Pandoraea apista TaxID=93218 RepID=UPI001EE4F6DA|nr:KTSC domain-containing protein [Pandoraea apista]
MTAQVDASPIAMKAVESSRIAEIGHNAETNTLAIRFKRGDGSHGALYHYANFTPEEFATFDSAESLGTHFSQHIKKETEKHPYLRVAEPPAGEEAATA